MSKVISFRLDENDPDQARALAILQRCQEQGFSNRQVLVEALLLAEGVPLTTKPDPAALVSELQVALAQVKALADQLSRGVALPPTDTPSESALNPELLSAIKRSKKKGFRLEE